MTARFKHIALTVLCEVLQTVNVWWQGPLADRAKLLCQPEDMFKQDMSMQSRVDLISTLPHVQPPACLQPAKFHALQSRGANAYLRTMQLTTSVSICGCLADPCLHELECTSAMHIAHVMQIMLVLSLMYHLVYMVVAGMAQYEQAGLHLGVSWSSISPACLQQPHYHVQVNVTIFLCAVRLALHLALATMFAKSTVVRCLACMQGLLQRLASATQPFNFRVISDSPAAAQHIAEATVNTGTHQQLLRAAVAAIVRPSSRS